MRMRRMAAGLLVLFALLAQAQPEDPQKAASEAEARQRLERLRTDIRALTAELRATVPSAASATTRTPARVR